MNKKLLPLLLIIAGTTLFACETTNNDEEETTYSIEVTNSFDFDLDLFINTGSNSSNVSYGTISAGQARTIADFELNNTYTLTATDVGGSPDNWIFQTEFSSTTTTMVNITLQPQF